MKEAVGLTGTTLCRGQFAGRSGEGRLKNLLGVETSLNSVHRVIRFRSVKRKRNGNRVLPVKEGLGKHRRTEFSDQQNP